VAFSDTVTEPELGYFNKINVCSVAKFEIFEVCVITTYVK